MPVVGLAAGSDLLSGLSDCDFTFATSSGDSFFSSCIYCFLVTMKRSCIMSSPSMPFFLPSSTASRNAWAAFPFIQALPQLSRAASWAMLFIISRSYGSLPDIILSGLDDMRRLIISSKSTAVNPANGADKVLAHDAAGATALAAAPAIPVGIAAVAATAPAFFKKPRRSGLKSTSANDSS